MMSSIHVSAARAENPLRAGRLAQDPVVESGEPGHDLIHVFWNEVCPDVRGSGDFEKLLIAGSHGLSEGFLGHVERVSLFARDYEQRDIDEPDLIGGVPGHQIKETAGGIAEG